MQERDLIKAPAGSLINSSSAAGSLINEQNNVLGLNSASRPRFKPQLGSNSPQIPDITNNTHAVGAVGSSGSGGVATSATGAGPVGGAPNQAALRCPRCDSNNTKFCYYNNYSLLQPRYFCKSCRRYWTKGGALRNVPVGGGCRKNKRMSRAAAVANVHAGRAAGSLGVGGGIAHFTDHQLMAGLPPGLSIGLHHQQQQHHIPHSLNININNPDIHHSHHFADPSAALRTGASAGLPPAPPLLYNFSTDHLNPNPNPNSSDHHSHGGSPAANPNANPNSLLQQVLLDQRHHPGSASTLLSRQLAAASGLINTGLINSQLHGSFNPNPTDHFNTDQQQGINLQNPNSVFGSSANPSRDHHNPNHEAGNLGFRAANFNLGLDSFSEQRDHWLKSEQKQQQILSEQKGIHHSLASLDISAQNLNHHLQHQSLQDQAAISNYSQMRSTSNLGIKSEEGSSSPWPTQNPSTGPHLESAAGTNPSYGGAPATGAGWQDLPSGYHVSSTDHHPPFM